MRCPFCDSQDTRVLETRTVDEGVAIRRKRTCPKCSKRFVTIEQLELQYPTVVKRNNTRVEFDINRIIAGLRRACEKREISLEAIEKLAKEIADELQNYPDKEVKTTLIGNLVMKRLKNLDDVAYIRFASVYRSFKDVTEFMDELTELKHLREKAKTKGV